MATQAPITDLPPAPTVSCKTMHMAGISVDVYGLDELPSPVATVSVLWLHHQRLRKKEDMADIASRCVSAWYAAVPSLNGPAYPDSANKTFFRSHGLLALAFSQRNHGERLVLAQANESWKAGNPTHAQDMFSIIAGTVADTQVLMDFAEAYLFPGKSTQIVQHMVLGVSLGGHSAWQLMFADDRVSAGAVIIGCPDFMSLMTHRAQRSKLPTATSETSPFIGSSDFPPSLVAVCKKSDPKAIMFGTDEVEWPYQDRAHINNLRRRIIGKRLLICSGADDKLVPYHCSKSFLGYLCKASEEWKDAELDVEDKVYPDTGHTFSPAMVADAVEFVVKSCAAGASQVVTGLGWGGFPPNRL